MGRGSNTGIVAADVTGSKSVCRQFPDLSEVHSLGLARLLPRDEHFHPPIDASKNIENFSIVQTTKPFSGTLASRKPMADSLTRLAAEQQRQFDATTAPRSRKERGHFGTTPAIADFMAGMFSPTARKSLRVLDAGAGVGTLSAAICHRILQERQPRQVELELWENDPRLEARLRTTMEACQRSLRDAGHERRLVAGIVETKDSYSPWLGLENHLNYIYRPKSELSEEEAFGLASLFNSRLIDRYFRAISGNTQVNAAEIRALPVPSVEKIREIGRAVAANPDRTALSVERTVAGALGISEKLIGD